MCLLNIVLLGKLVSLWNGNILNLCLFPSIGWWERNALRSQYSEFIMKSIVPVQSCSVKFYILEFVRNRNSERIFHARKENVNIPCGTAQTLERIFEFIDQNVKKNTLNSNDAERERESYHWLQEYELSREKMLSVLRAKNVLTEWTLSCFILWK